MIVKQHLAFAALISIIISVAFFNENLFLSLIIIFGCLTGAIIPDIHMKKPMRSKLLIPAYYAARISGMIFIPLIVGLYRIYPKVYTEKNDRRLTHSIPGMAIIIASLAILLEFGFLLIYSPLTDYCTVFSSIFLGFASGIILHMATDACTFKGVFPLFPIRNLKVSGNIRPCDITDKRITCFLSAFALLSVATILLYYLNLPVMTTRIVAFTGVSGIIIMMFLSSKAGITYDDC